MSTHFISVLGTSLYQPVIYEAGEPQNFVQISLLQRFREQLQGEDDKISFVMTEGAKQANWFDRPYSEKDKKDMTNWPEEARDKGEIKKGLQSRIEESFPEFGEKNGGKSDKIEVIDIPEGHDSGELWQIFQQMYDCIRNDDTVIFDITHSFRSIPMLAIAAINYAKVMKNCTLAGIYYGAFEARKGEKEKVQTAPIFDLTVYDEIMSWTHAADSLARYGNPQEILQIVNNRVNTTGIPKEERRQWKNIRNHLTAMSNLTNCLDTCRGASGRTVHGQKNSRTKSIQAAYESVKNTALDEEAQNITQTWLPLYELTRKAEEAYARFDCTQNYETGLQAVQWYLDHNLLQQGFTALEETAKTFLCFFYGLPEEEYETREVVNEAINKLICAKKKEPEKPEAMVRVEILHSIQDGTITNDHTPDQKWRNSMLASYEQYGSAWDQLVMEVPVRYAWVIQSLKTYRNDLNHFGMNATPGSAIKLKEQLAESYRRLTSIMEEMMEADKGAQT